MRQMRSSDTSGRALNVHLNEHSGHYTMLFRKPFFDLQLQFAHRVTELSGASLPQVLLGYSTLYIRFGLGRDFDPCNRIWQEYIAGLNETGDIGDWTYRFYLARQRVIGVQQYAGTFGCFSYDLRGDLVRIHFQNADTEEYSSLASVYQQQRRGELAELFSHVKQRQPQSTHVLGISWLYNLNAYRRLFPDSYIATASVQSNKFRYMTLWGQFLNRHGDIRKERAEEFITRLYDLESMEELNECFPFQVLKVRAPLQDFFDFYGI